MEFDLILTNPPFQDSARRGKTPHKLWIEFTLRLFSNSLKAGGSLVQVSPSSFASPSNRVLRLIADHQTNVLRFGTEHHFPGVGSSFSDYWIEKSLEKKRPTFVVAPSGSFVTSIDSSLFYLPNDICEHSLSIHSKVMFTERAKLPVRWDYVGAHNIKRRGENPSLVEEPDSEHPFPVFHTNRKTWWSSDQQKWARQKKVMWTRSGYTKPFYDSGRLGGTDMAYFVPVRNAQQGTNLAHNLNSALFRYIFMSARWSGFGNERVFAHLPELPRYKRLTDPEMFALFDLSDQEVEYVQSALEPDRRKAE